MPRCRRTLKFPSSLTEIAHSESLPYIEAGRLGDQAGDAGWSHEEYLAVVLSREVSEREPSGAALRIKTARFPGQKALGDFSFDHQPSADRNPIAHLGTSTFVTEAKNVVLLGPPASKTPPPAAI